MKTCKTCRWWNTADDYVSEFQNDKTKTCDRIHAAGGGGNRSAVVYPVGDGWLSTSPDFGCSLHETTP